MRVTAVPVDVTLRTHQAINGTNPLDLYRALPIQCQWWATVKASVVTQPRYTRTGQPACSPRLRAFSKYSVVQLNRPASRLARDQARRIPNRIERVVDTDQARFDVFDLCLGTRELGRAGNDILDVTVSRSR